MIAATLVGAAAAVLLATFAGGAAGQAWHALRHRPQPLLECLVGLFGVICVASAATLGLYRLWSGAWVPGPGDPFFAAALAGTLAGHAALLAWAKAIRADLALVPADARWVATGAAAGALGVMLSLAWVEIASWFGLPVIDQEIVADVLASPDGPGRAATLFFIVGVAPVLEELVFRGFLQTSLTRAIGAVPAAAASAVTFGLFHMSDPPVVPVLIAIGGLFAWLRLKSGSVLPGMVGHAVNNGIAMALAMVAT